MDADRSKRLSGCMARSFTASRGVPRAALARAGLLLMGALAGCEVVDRDANAGKQDTTTAPGIVPESARGTLPTDSAAGVPATPAESSFAAAATDTGMVQLHPLAPRRGGVLFALAEGVATPSPRCSWKSAPIPCYHMDDGVVVTVPLPADEDAGTFTLTIDRPSGRIVRQVTIADHDFGRELIFLTDPLYR